METLYLTPAERYTAALGGFYYGDLPEAGTVYTQLIKDILDGSAPDKEPKNILARFIYSLYISDLGDPYPRYELAKLLYWKLHDVTPTKSGSVLTVTIDGKEDYMTINTDLSRLWYKVLFGSKTDIITEFPYVFNTMQNKLSDWELFGNTVQSGTPTPDNPIQPQGTGERTGNLFDKDNFTFGTGTTIAYIPLYVGDGTFTLLTDFPDNETKDVFFLSGNVDSGASSATNGVDVHKSRTISSIDGYVTIATRYNSVRENPADYNYMLNTGSTALPYEPFGVKIPISSAGQTTPVYLGEVQTTRRIKKLVLTGEETWYIYKVAHPTGYDIHQFYTQNMGINSIQYSSCYSNITPYGMTSNTRHTGEYGCYTVSLGQEIAFQMIGVTDTIPDVPTWKQYLAQQYAAGTPVTIWYVLAEPETAVVNEPLMKIGEYADSISRAQTGIDIPTVIGQNTLDVLTTVKPSSMSIEYTSADETRSRSKRISLLKSPLKKGLIK